MKKILSISTIACLLTITSLLCSCPSNETTTTTTQIADLVMYGSIYTAENNNPNAQAIAVKNGKYIYVGSKDGAKKYIDSKTKVEDYIGNGMIMPACTEGHSHFVLAEILNLMGSFRISETADKDAILNTVSQAYTKAKEDGKKILFGYGWNNAVFTMTKDYPTCADLDKIGNDIPIYLADEEMHKAIVNTFALKEAGILNDDGTPKITSIKGGEIGYDVSGDATGLLIEQAANFVRINLKELGEVVTKDLAKQAFINVQEQLLKAGYTYYMDGWANFFTEKALYEAAKELDNNKDLKMCIGLPYEFDSYVNDIDAEIKKAKNFATTYSCSRINANYVKIFMDGTYGGFTAFTLKPYPQQTENINGIPNWDAEAFTEVTKKANKAGLTMHVHTMGDAAIKRCIDAFESSGIKECRNTLVHVQNVATSDFQRIKDNNVCCAVGILWHAMSEAIRDLVSQYWPEDSTDKSYPIKSHLDCGTCVSSSSDYPALSGSPWEPFKIMKIAVTGQLGNETPWNTDELCTREEMLKILTINGAYQMHIEKERGSIKVGKYADFIYVDKDVFAKNGSEYVVLNNQLNDVKVIKTYFEGK